MAPYTYPLFCLASVALYGALQLRLKLNCGRQIAWLMWIGLAGVLVAGHFILHAAKNHEHLALGLLAMPVGFGACLWVAVHLHFVAVRKAAVSTAEQRFQTLLDGLPCECWALDEAGRFCLFNRQAQTRRGEGFLGKTLAECADRTSPESFEVWERAARRAFSGEGTGYRYTVEEAGEKRHFEAVITPVRSEGNVVGVIGVHFDVSARVACEKARRAAEEALSLQVRQSPMGYVEWDLNFKIQTWNPAAEALFEIPAGEAVGSNGIDLLFPINERTAIEVAWRDVHLNRGQRRLEHTHIRRDGARRLCEWHHTAVIDADGMVTGLVSFVQDITARSELEIQLRHVQRLDSMGQLACGLAQELNHLFTPAVIHLDLLENSHREIPGLMEQVKPVREAFTQAIGLGQRILTLGRNSETEPTLWQPLNPHVQDTVDLLRRTLDPRLRVIVLLSPDLPPLPLQPTVITQIVINLLLNARDAVLDKFAHPPPDWKPLIRVSTSTLMAAARNAVGQTTTSPRLCQCIEISDTGSGMTDVVRQRLFEPFFTTKGPGRGTGLGLPITRKGVQALGGWIEFDSTPGEGTTFRVYLPSPKQALTSPPVTASTVAETAGPGRHVLLAEDDEMVASALTLGLKRAGHQVTCATDGAAALALIRLEPSRYDLVVTDLNMPNLGGRDLLAALARDGISTPVMVLSGYITSAILEELRAMGAAEVLRKPIRIGELLGAINRQRTHATSCPV